MSDKKRQRRLAAARQGRAKGATGQGTYESEGKLDLGRGDDVFSELAVAALALARLLLYLLEDVLRRELALVPARVAGLRTDETNGVLSSRSGQRVGYVRSLP